MAGVGHALPAICGTAALVLVLTAKCRDVAGGLQGRKGRFDGICWEWDRLCDGTRFVPVWLISRPATVLVALIVALIVLVVCRAASLMLSDWLLSTAIVLAVVELGVE